MSRKQRLNDSGGVARGGWNSQSRRESGSRSKQRGTNCFASFGTEGVRLPPRPHCSGLAMPPVQLRHWPYKVLWVSGMRKTFRSLRSWKAAADQETQDQAGPWVSQQVKAGCFISRSIEGCGCDALPGGGIREERALNGLWSLTMCQF